MDENKKNECGCGCEHNHEEHSHEHECGCGCDHDVEALETMELELDDGSVLKCGVIGIFDCVEEYEGEYIALLPETSEDVMFYRYSEDEEANPILTNIESDEEYEAVGDTFMELIEDEDDCDCDDCE